MRKSSVTSRSSLPSGALSCQTTSAGLASSAPRSLPCTPWLVPSRCLRKYSWPLPLEPSRLERQTNRLRGQLCRVVRVFAAHLQRAVLQRLDRVVLRVHAGGLRVAHHLHRVGLQLRRARAASPCARRARCSRSCCRRTASCRPAARGPLPRPASRSATGRCARRRSWCCSSGAAGGSSRARRPAPSSRSAGAAFPGPT